jgi:hypothetical protein
MTLFTSVHGDQKPSKRGVIRKSLRVDFNFKNMKNKIYKIISIITVFALVTGCSSNSDSQSTSNSDYLEITIDGKSFKQEIYHGGTGSSGQSGCVNKPHFLQFLGQIETSAFFFDSNILHLENDVDFKNSVVGAYATKQENITNSSACNLDLVISFEDKTQSVKTTQLITGGNNTIASIKKGKSTDTEYEYIIIGNFSASFKNKSNVIIPVSGKYQITIVVYK